MCPAGQHRPGYRPPRRGERRTLDRRLAVDFLPQETRDRLVAMYTQEARTWEEVAAISETLVPWKKLPAAVLKRFPHQRVSEKMLRTWWDLRVEQAGKRAREERQAVESLVAEWGAKEMPGLDQAALNTLARLVLSVELAPNPFERRKAAAALLHARIGFERLRLEEKRQGIELQKLERLEAAGKKLVGDLKAGKVKGDSKDIAERIERELNL